MEIVRVITTHAGGKPLNGGEYEFSILYTKVDDGWEVTHKTSAEFPYCPVLGSFQECESCWNWDIDRKRCMAEKEVISDEELQKRLEGCTLEYESGDTKVYNGTGHEYTPCRYDGGCVICYPCGHGCGEVVK